MKAYLDTGVFIDYLYLRNHSGPHLRSAPRRGRVPNQLGADAERCLKKLAVRHTTLTSSLTCYEVEEALYAELKTSTGGVSDRGKFLVAAARAIATQTLITIDLFGIHLVDLTPAIIEAQVGNLELQKRGIRAADALHVTTALLSDADILVTADDNILSIDSCFKNASGQVLRCLDTDGALTMI